MYFEFLEECIARLSFADKLVLKFETLLGWRGARLGNHWTREHQSFGFR